MQNEEICLSVEELEEKFKINIFKGIAHLKTIGRHINNRLPNTQKSDMINYNNKVFNK
jgi:hypothetical protein